MGPRYKLSELLVWITILAVLGAVGRALEMQLVITSFITWLLIIAMIERWTTTETALWISMAIGAAFGIAPYVLPNVTSSPNRINVPELLMLGFVFGAGLGIFIWGIALGLNRLVARISCRLSLVKA